MHNPNLKVFTVSRFGRLKNQVDVGLYRIFNLSVKGEARNRIKNGAVLRRKWKASPEFNIESITDLAERNKVIAKNNLERYRNIITSNLANNVSKKAVNELAAFVHSGTLFVNYLSDIVDEYANTKMDFNLANKLTYWISVQNYINASITSTIKFYNLAFGVYDLVNIKDTLDHTARLNIKRVYYSLKLKIWDIFRTVEEKWLEIITGDIAEHVSSNGKYSKNSKIINQFKECFIHRPSDMDILFDHMFPSLEKLIKLTIA